MRIEYVDINAIKPYENNAKRHTPEQIEEIKESIKEFGMNDPIAIWKDNVVIEGHGRLIACQELGIEKVPVIRLDGLSDDQRRAYMLIHNKLTISSGFDQLLLLEELDNITEIDMERFGFTDKIDGALDYGDMFIDAEEKKKQMQCPYCGEWFDI